MNRFLLELGESSPFLDEDSQKNPKEMENILGAAQVMIESLSLLKMKKPDVLVKPNMLQDDQSIVKEYTSLLLQQI